MKAFMWSLVIAAVALASPAFAAEQKAPSNGTTVHQGKNFAKKPTEEKKTTKHSTIHKKHQKKKKSKKKGKATTATTQPAAAPKTPAAPVAPKAPAAPKK